MKIVVEEIMNILDTEIVIKCQRNNEQIKELISALELFDKSLIVKKENENYILSPQDIYYFECVDDKIFAYCEKEVYSTTLRLYEIDTLYPNSFFLRVNKNLVLNVSKISSFKSTINGRMEAKLKNGEKVEISRNYVPALKLMLGGRR